MNRACPWCGQNLIVHAPGPARISGGVVATGIVGAIVLARHGARRTEGKRLGAVRMKSTSQRVIKLAALGVGGLIATGAMLFLAAIALFILLVLVCFGGFKL
jgi:hypothetical protein